MRSATRGFQDRFYTPDLAVGDEQNVERLPFGLLIGQFQRPAQLGSAQIGGQLIQLRAQRLQGFGSRRTQTGEK